MIGMVMVNLIAGRRSAPTTVLAAALLAVLLVDPFSVLSAGFWLSFAAVAVILLAVSGRSPGVSQWRGWWWRWGRIQAIVAVGLSPLTLGVCAAEVLSPDWAVAEPSFRLALGNSGSMSF